MMAVGDHSAGTRGQRKAAAAGLHRIGGHRIEMADAAGRQHHGAGGHGDGVRAGVMRLAQLQAGDGVLAGQQRLGDIALDHLDRRRLLDGVDQRGDDRLAGAVALHMDDAARRMRGLAADRKAAFQVAVERHAIL